MLLLLSPAYQLCFLLLILLIPFSSTLDLPILTGSGPVIPFKDLEVRGIKFSADCGSQKWKKFDGTETGEFKPQCRLHPWMTAVFEDGSLPNSDDFMSVFSNANNCKYLVTCNGATDTNAETVCDSTGYGMFVKGAAEPDKVHNRVSPVDPHCDIGDWEHERLFKLAHRWRIDYFQKYNKIIANNPSDKAREDLYIRVPLSYPGETPYQKEANILAHAHFNVKKGNALDGWTFTTCGDGCHYGQILGIDFQPNDQPLIDIFVKDTCNWVSVCTNYNGKCKANSMIHIMIRNGFVVFMGNRRTQSTLLMHRKQAGGNEAPVHIQLASTVSELLTFDLKTKTERSIWAVTSMYRERAVGETTGLGRLLLIFDKEDCLAKDFGVRSKARIDVYLPADQAKQTTIKTENQGLQQYSGSQDPRAQKTAVTEDIRPTTLATTPPPSAAPETTTTAFDPSALGGLKSPKIAKKESVDERGHMLWAVFYGWLSGSFLAILLISSIMFFCRRTFFASWYRGMYKRYQCDASGTTGGVTGVGFGADQTSGGSSMQTIQTMDGSNTSQMGTTGGGETSTMGTTGGAETPSQVTAPTAPLTPANEANEVTAKSNKSAVE